MLDISIYKWKKKKNTVEAVFKSPSIRVTRGSKFAF